MTFRKVLFWAHLVAGLISGIAIAIMCFTGTVLAFEKELVAWAERGARRIEVPTTNAARLSIGEMQAKLREAQPDARPMSIVFQNTPGAAVAFSAGRSGGYYVNPYTGEVRQPKSGAMGEFMHTMTDLHRYLGFHGEASRPRGKWINGVCNIAFFALAVTGLYLWMPRTWSWRALRPIVWFRQNSSSRARDFNWHNTIGLWTSPVLIVLTLTAIPISFRWGGNLIATLTGSEAPTAGGPPGGGAALAGGPAPEIAIPAPGAPLLSQDALLATVQSAVPAWKTITLRTGSAGPGGPGGRGGAGGRGGEGRGGARGGAGRGGAGAGTRSPEGENRSSATPPAGEARPASPSAVTFAVREASSWPRTATTTLLLHPYTGEILRRTGYADMAAAQQVRSWTRFLHTGEALGWPGQLIAGLACLGGLFLVYTGFALAWVRLVRNRGSKGRPLPVAASTAQPAAAKNLY